jgi:hypothetical protein
MALIAAVIKKLKSYFIHAALIHIEIGLQAGVAFHISVPKGEHNGW